MARSKVDIGVLLGAGSALSSRSRAGLVRLIEDLYALADSEYKRVLTNPGDSPQDETFILDLSGKLMKLLESSEWTNAGRGSELTIEGTVECDATIMLGGDRKQEASASVGALQGIEYPSVLCRRLLELQLQTTEDTQRSVPNFIAGPGAQGYGVRLGLSTADLTTDRARNSLAKWKSRLEDVAAPTNTANDKFLDTVGLIVVYEGIIVAASSSGGSLMKDPGRVGPAALVGSGLDINANSAAVCSGFGEDINALRLASKAVSTDLDLSELTTLSRARLQRTPAQFGVLRAAAFPNATLFEWYHSTPSLVCGIGSVGEVPPSFKVVDSTKPAGGGRKV